MGDSNLSPSSSRPIAIMFAALTAFGLMFVMPKNPTPTEKPGESPGTNIISITSLDANREVDYRSPLLNFARTSKQAAAGGKLAQVIADLDYDLEFLIATVPDPVDSHQGYRFDLTLEAIQRALESQQFRLDRWYLPWDLANKSAKKNKKGDNPPKRLHKEFPGALLFHTREPSKAGKKSKLLLVLLVGETPTSGIQRTAMTTSLDFIRDNGGVAGGKRIRILGPSFSGSTTSLALTLGAWSKAQKIRAAPETIALSGLLQEPLPVAISLYHLYDPEPRFFVITGSATSINRDTFKNRARPADLDFSATVHSDEDVLNELVDYMKPKHSSLRVALLVESDTAYGQNTQKSAVKDARIKMLPFPLHVSQVRTVYNKETIARDATLPYSTSESTKLPLPFEEGGQFQDIVPPLSRGMTAAIAELTLAHMLAAIAREDFRYVGLMATDTRDKLFLAGLVRDHCPNVQLFTIQSDILLSHPNYRQYMKGTIVGSTYPLLFKNQFWAPTINPKKRDRLVPLSEESDVGVYNATLALLGKYNDMIEYGPPAYELDESKPAPRPMCPPIWISIIGERGPWPLKVIHREAENREAGKTPIYWPDEKQLQDQQAEDAKLAKKKALANNEADQEGLAKAEQQSMQERLALRFPGYWLLLLLIVVFSVWSLCAAYLRAAFTNKIDGTRWDEIISYFQIPPIGSSPTSESSRGQKVIYIYLCFASAALFFAFLMNILRIPRELLYIGALNVWGMTPIFLVLATFIFLLIVLCHLLWISGSLGWRPFLYLGVFWGLSFAWGRFFQESSLGESILPFLGFIGLIALGCACLVCRGEHALFAKLKPWVTFFFTDFIRAAAIFFPLELIFIVMGFNPWKLTSYESDTAQHAYTQYLPYFERMITLDGGVTPVIPAFFLMVVTCCWSLFHLKRLYLLKQFRVPNPFITAGCAGTNNVSTHPEVNRITEIIKAIRDAENDVLKILHNPWREVSFRMLPFCVWIGLGFGLLYLYYRSLPTVECAPFDRLLRLGFLATVVFFVGTLMQFLFLWHKVRKLLKRLVSLPMASSYDLLPSRISDMFGRYFSNLRPKNSYSQRIVPSQQRQVLAQYYEAAVTAKAIPENDPTLKAAWQDLGMSLQESALLFGPVEVPSEERINEKIDKTICEIVQSCVNLLQYFWPNRSVEDAFGHPTEISSSAVKLDPYPLSGQALAPHFGAVLRQAEALVAIRAVPFIGQFFVHLRNMVTYLALVSFLMILAVGSYPFQPQRLLILWCWTAIFMIVVLTVTFFIQADREELLSRISKTKSGSITFDWTFFSSVSTYAVPLALVLVAQIPFVGDWIGYLLAPLVRGLR